MAIPELRLNALGEWARIEKQVQVAAGPAARRSWREVVASLAAAVIKLGLLALLPLLALVRVSVFLYLHQRTPAWLALLAGAACTMALVTTYASWVWRRLTGRLRLQVIARRVALPLVLAYCGYALIYLSSANAKSAQVRAYYTSLHPLLRVALSTLIVVDEAVVITDLARQPEGYAAMRLPVHDGSLHYLQRDGYAHAADLRSTGWSAVKNRLVQLYFIAMGFDTLRHTGTADHLHVELQLR